MRRLVLLLVMSLAGCGGCIDDDAKSHSQSPQGDLSHVRRQRAVGMILTEVDAGLAAGDP
jgi:hypothetical protein